LPERAELKLITDVSAGCAIYYLGVGINCCVLDPRVSPRHSASCLSTYAAMLHVPGHISLLPTFQGCPLFKLNRGASVHIIHGSSPLPAPHDVTPRLRRSQKRGASHTTHTCAHRATVVVVPRTMNNPEQGLCCSTGDLIAADSVYAKWKIVNTQVYSSTSPDRGNTPQ
jgi:hypothetical protein